MILVRIIGFMFILGLVLNGLAVLNLASTSFISSDQATSTDPNTQLGLIETQIALVMGAGLAAMLITWVVLANVPTTSAGGLPMNQIFGYGIFGGLVTVSLFGGISTVQNIFELMPGDAKVGGAIVFAIILAIIGFVATLGFIEITVGKEL